MIGQGRHLDWAFDPLEALQRWPADRRALLLHSGRFHSRWARRSIMAEPAGTYQFVMSPDGRGCSRWLGSASPPGSVVFTDKPFHDLDVLCRGGDGIWIGCLSYDLGRWIERLPEKSARDRDWPIIELAYCPGYLVYDLAAQRWSACGTWDGGDLPDLAALAAVAGTFEAAKPQSVFSRTSYEAAAARVIEYIAAGDVFQVNLAQRFTADFSGAYPAAPRAAFDRLARVSPAWYGAYLELAEDGAAFRRTIASTSPELFLEIDVHGGVVTRPIKGTRPAAADADELRRSVKDAAELHMIVDLLRNDLGRVCAYGSVRVSEPRVIESHPTVHHGVATIAGSLHPSRGVADLLRATMPGGSVTGAPKIRAMQIIDEIEPVRRGPYCGAIGFLSREESCFNVAIRTLLIEQENNGRGRVDFSVGGGIVADSDPFSEYQETLDKAAAMLAALGLKL